jgi:hypothetical protein
MFYRIQNKRLYDYADYRYSDECLETNIITQAELDEHRNKVIIQDNKLVLNPNYAEEESEKERLQQIAALKDQLDEIDKKKIRSTSAIALNIATEFDYTKLRELENQAQNIREQIQRLGG